MWCDSGSNGTNVVTFSYSDWSLRYPELAGSVSAPLAQLYFNESQLYCDNTPCSVICNLVERELLLNMLTAHIAATNAQINGQPASPLVGRISNATEGSVSVATQLNINSNSSQWFTQTKYGIAYWQATAKYRTMRYVLGPRPLAVPFRRPY